MIKLWQFFNNNGDWLLIGALFIVVIILFIRDFDLTSRRSWLMLLSLFALGAVMLFKTMRKNRLLKEMKQREEALKDLEKEYDDLKEKHEISEENYKKARESLEEAKKRMIRDLIKAEQEHEERLKEIEREMKNKSADELMELTENILKS